MDRLGRLRSGQQLFEETETSVNHEGSLINVLNLSVVTFLVLLGLSMVAPILPSYAESFDVSYTLVGFVISSFALTRMTLDMPAGLLTKRVNKKKIMITGLLLLSTSSILAGLAPNYLILIVARMIEGAGSALYVTTATVFLAQIAGTEKRGQWMSMYMGFLLMGSIFGPTFGGILADVYDFRAPFFAYAIITGVGILPTLLLPNLANTTNSSDPFDTKEIKQDIKQVLTTPSFLLVNFAIFTTFLLRTGVRTTLVPLFAANNLGLSSGDIGIVLTVAGITTAIAIVPMGSISDRIGRKIPLILCLIFSAATILFIPLSGDMTDLLIISAIYGAVIGLSGPSAAYITDVAPENKIEIAMGLYRTLSDLGFVVGPILLGYLADVTATPVPGETHSGLIGIIPFAVTSFILILAIFVLIKADDPVRDARKMNSLDIEAIPSQEDIRLDE